MSLYFIAVEPHPELSDEIRLVQKDFKDRFASQKSFNSFPHITIIPPFMHDEQNESEVTGHFLKTPLDIPPFEISLNGFMSFPNKKNPVIFIKPEPNENLLNLFRHFNRSMDVFHYVGHFNPHITVAYRDLGFTNYLKAWKEYETKEFTARFNVNSVGLYKHFDRKWNLISTKELKNPEALLQD